MSNNTPGFLMVYGTCGKIRLRDPETIFNFISVRADPDDGLCVIILILRWMFSRFSVSFPRTAQGQMPDRPQ